MSKPDLRQPDKYIFINGHIMAKPDYQIELNQKQKEKIQQYNDIMQAQLKNYYGQPKNTEDFNNMINDVKTGERKNTFEINKKSAMTILERLYDKMSDKQKAQEVMLLYDMIKNESDINKFDEILDVSSRLNQQYPLLNTNNEIYDYVKGIIEYLTTGNIQRDMLRKNLKYDVDDKIAQALLKLETVNTSNTQKFVSKLENSINTTNINKLQELHNLLNHFINQSDLNSETMSQYIREYQNILDSQSVSNTQISESEIMPPPPSPYRNKETDIDETDYTPYVDSDEEIYPDNGKQYVENMEKLNEYLKNGDTIKNGFFKYNVLNAENKPDTYEKDIKEMTMGDYSLMRLIDSIDGDKLLKSNDETLIKFYRSLTPEYDKNGNILEQVKKDKKAYDKYINDKNKNDADEKKKAEERQREAEEKQREAEEKQKEAEEKANLRTNETVDSATKNKYMVDKYGKIRDLFQVSNKKELSNLGIILYRTTDSKYYYNDIPWTMKEIHMNQLPQIKKDIDKAIKNTNSGGELKNSNAYKQLTEYVNNVNKIGKTNTGVSDKISNLMNRFLN